MKERKEVMLGDSDSSLASPHSLPGGASKCSAHAETENCTGGSYRPRDMVAMGVWDSQSWWQQPQEGISITTIVKIVVMIVRITVMMIMKHSH